MRGTYAQRMTLVGDISIALTLSTMLTALAAGLAVRHSDAIYLLRHPRRLGRAFFAINVAMPFCALWFADVFSLEPPIELALIVLAMSPLPIAIPAALRRSDIAATFGARLIAADSLIALATIPLSLAALRGLFGAPFTIALGGLTWVLATRITAPLVLGVAIARIRPGAGAQIATLASGLGVVLLAAALVLDLILVGSSLLPLSQDGTVVAIVALVVIGIFLGYVLGGPSHVDRAVLAIGNAWRHPGVAWTVASAAYHDNARASASLLASVVIGTIAIRPFVWRRIHAPQATTLRAPGSRAM